MCVRILLTVLLATLAAADGFAKSVAELAALHAEAMGGAKRIAALAAVRAKGQVSSAGKRVDFTMVAARPNQIRLETESGGRTLVQATDGKEPPWEFDTGTWPPRYRAMAAANSATFQADAEFDDPLIAGEKRGFKIENAGEADVDGRKLLRLHVVRGKHENFHLLLDPRTYLILLRVEQRQATGGKAQLMVTRFEDFKPVFGVFLPHTVTLMIDGKVAQTTKVERIEPNPKLAPDTFSRPKPAAK